VFIHFPVGFGFRVSDFRAGRSRTAHDQLTVRHAPRTVAIEKRRLVTQPFLQPTMDHTKFDEALDSVLTNHRRYDRAAYYFLRDALDYTLKVRKKATGETGHITGPQLLEGIRQHALKQFGPMVPTVFDYWGLRRTEDFGVMVFDLVDVGIFGKTDKDSLDDFKEVYSFYDAFVDPFLPKSAPAPVRQISVDTPATELN
jgi:uncharacterized repeat protein (TIGR04138 family)